MRLRRKRAGRTNGRRTNFLFHGGMLMTPPRMGTWSRGEYVRGVLIDLGKTWSGGIIIEIFF